MIFVDENAYGDYSNFYSKKLVNAKNT